MKMTIIRIGFAVTLAVTATGLGAATTSNVHSSPQATTKQYCC